MNSDLLGYWTDAMAVVKLIVNIPDISLYNKSNWRYGRRRFGYRPVCWLAITIREYVLTNLQAANAMSLSRYCESPKL